jgi:hypothetical protein
MYAHDLLEQYKEGLKTLNSETQEYFRKLCVDMDNADFFGDAEHAKLCREQAMKILVSNGIAE